MSSPFLASLGIGVRVGAVSATGGIGLGVLSVIATAGTIYYYRKTYCGPSIKSDDKEKSRDWVVVGNMKNTQAHL